MSNQPSSPPQSPKFYSNGHLQTRALHSELLTELSSRVSSRNKSGQVGTSSEKSSKNSFPTNSDPNFAKNAFFAIFSRKLGSERVFASRDEFGKSSNNLFQP